MKKIFLKRKGFILADAFVAFSVAAMLSTTILGALYVSDQNTKRQIDQLDVNNVMTSISEELKSAKNLDTTGMGNVTNQNNAVTGNVLLLDTKVQGNLYEYNIKALLENDTINKGFQIITITAEWVDSKGELKSKELKSFKVA